MRTLMIALLLVSIVACKKKQETPAATGSAAAGSGSAMGAGSAPGSGSAMGSGSDATGSAAVGSGAASNKLGEHVMRDETIGGLKIGASADEVTKVLGKPKKKGKAEEEGATGDVVSMWEWPGVMLGMVKDERGGWSVRSFQVKAPSTLATSKGIKVGSTRAEIEAAYEKSSESESEGDSPDSFLVGSVYGGEIFQLANGKVTEIFIGAMAE